MHAIGATLTSGGGTLLICVHQFTVAFGARDDTRQRASVSFVCPIAHAPCRRCRLPWRLAAIARGVRSSSTHPVYTRLPDVEARVGARRHPTPPGEGPRRRASSSTPSRKRNDRPLY